ncbi:uncharacterized protein EV422DRAFT_564745 [Fimicolochytrium jonesii]|uniref:uncharacterized protein n=1 Tax=Fimicolochytrium jonesii TaxID=1396493 RepID=UPI0022FEF8A9|nr:uncharacterized protein EV422DRAFT_564745 [Fimicolochytrium jonesii]KAI8824039.1 hypothetical protein EV422DRAFT_564745 [Fimicolochytrium jonesii]
MTSLIAPLGCWLSSPFDSSSVVTAAAATEDGCVVVAGFESGVAWIFAADQEEPFMLRPKVLLAGHRSSICVITLAKIEVEGAAKKENIILTASEDGEVVMWDITDGRCLQANPEAFSGVMTAMKMSSSGRWILCSGHSRKLAVLESASLVSTKNIDIHADWIHSMAIYPTDTKYVDRIFCTTFSGEVCTAIFDGQALTATPETKIPLEKTRSFGPSGVIINRFDKSIIMVQQRAQCKLYSTANGALSAVSEIPCKEGKIWEGGTFLSAKTFLLWTSSSAHVFYIGAASDVLKAEQASSVPTGAIVLFAQGSTIYYVAKMETGPSRGGVSVTEIAVLNSPIDDPDSSPYVFYSHGKAVGHQRLLRFHSTAKITYQQFFGSLVGSELKSTQVPTGACEQTAEIDLRALWPGDATSQKNVTALTSALHKYVALGYDTGAISLLTMAEFFQTSDTSESEPAVSLEGHKGPVTYLYVPSPRECGGRNLLLSAAQDCFVKIWNLDDGQLLASFLNHAEEVISILPVPADAQQRSRCSVVTVARDHSLAFIDLDNLTCTAHLFGHTDAVTALHWRIIDEIVIVECVDGTAYVWQLKTGHLDRTLDGADVLDVIGSSDCSLDCRFPQLAFRNANIKRSFSAYPVSTAEDAIPCILALLVNTKRVVNETTGKMTMTPPPTPPLSVAPSFVSTTTTTATLTNRATPTHSRTASSALYPDSAANQNRTGSPNMISQNLHHFSQGFKDIFRSRPGSPSPSSIAGGARKSDTSATANRGSQDSNADGTRGALENEVVQAILSALYTWGLSTDLDKLIEVRVGLSRPKRNIAFGMRGANGHLSFIAPTKDAVMEWGVSPTISAARLLNTMATFRALLTSRGLEEEWVALMAFYGDSLPATVGNQYAFPSFSFLAKYWQDPIPEIQSTTRTIFHSTLLRMTPEEKASGIAYWHTHLPSLTKHYSKLNIRAVIILGIIGSTQPESLSPTVCKDVAESLDQLLKEDSPRNVYRTAAVELLGAGWADWEVHVNGTALLRTLIGFSGLSGGGGGANTSGNGGATPTGAPPTTPSLVTTPSLNPPLVAAARQAIVQIATCNPALFISTLSFDLMHSKSAVERAGALRLLGMFIAKKPLILYPHLGRMVEAIVKCLDPNQPHIRDALQHIVTVIFAELVKRFPNVAFHHTSQRLAVGTMEGVGVVYDVRIAAKVQIMEGHTKPITAVSFSPDGKLIATYSLIENTLRFWQPTGGFLGTLVGALTTATGGGAGGAAGVAALASVGGVGHMKSFRTFSLGPPDEKALNDPTAVMDGVRFEWVGERKVVLHSTNGLPFTFTV